MNNDELWPLISWTWLAIPSWFTVCSAGDAVATFDAGACNFSVSAYAIATVASTHGAAGTVVRTPSTAVPLFSSACCWGLLQTCFVVAAAAATVTPSIVVAAVSFTFMGPAWLGRIPVAVANACGFSAAGCAAAAAAAANQVISQER